MEISFLWLMMLMFLLAMACFLMGYSWGPLHESRKHDPPKHIAMLTNQAMCLIRIVETKLYDRVVQLAGLMTKKVKSLQDWKDRIDRVGSLSVLLDLFIESLCA